MTSEQSNLQRWVDQRELEAPPALASRLREAINAMPRNQGRTVPGAALEASLALLDTLLRGADASRAGALGLLTADALITYAFEASADEPERLDALCTEAIRRIAAAATAEAELPQ